MKTVLGSTIISSVAAFIPGLDPAEFEKLVPKDLDKAPQCEPFSCDDGSQVAVQSFDAGAPKVSHYGCNLEQVLNDFGLEDLTKMSMGFLNNKGLQKCCAKAALCQATCGMPVESCWSNFNKCSVRAAKSLPIPGVAEPFAKFHELLKDFPGKIPKGTMDFQEIRCANYDNAQKKNCRCVDKSDKESAIESAAKAIYKAGGEKDPDSKMSAAKDKYISKDKGAELISSLFYKFENKLNKVVKRPNFKLSDIPGIGQILKNPMLKMGIQAAGIDLSEFGIDLDELIGDDDEASEDESKDESEL